MYGNIGNSHRPRSFQFVIGRLWKSCLGSIALLETHTVPQGWSQRLALGCVIDDVILKRTARMDHDTFVAGIKGVFADPTNFVRERKEFETRRRENS